MPKPFLALAHIVPSPRRLLVPLLPLAVGLTVAGCLDRPISPARPTTTNLYVNTIANSVVDKVDLLFMIDNSASMADKQRFLADAVPVLVRRLVTPRCLDATGKPNGDISDQTGHCARGRPEFSSVKDIHVGVITSSLGGYGGTQCGPEDPGSAYTPDDRAELLPSANPAVRGALDSWNGKGFLAWDPSQTKNTPPGDANLDHLVASFGDQVKKAGELGCGYEGSLESWYRFLIDPEPPGSVTTTIDADGRKVNQLGPVNQTVLAQRAAFLRHDSLLAIVMLTDENDCSINDADGTQGFIAASPDIYLPRSSSACAVSANDPCCHTCADTAPANCTPNESDSECSQANAGDKYAVVTKDKDNQNLRCFHQRERFGLDFLHPVQRYIDGLTKTKVRNRHGEEVPNPIFEAPPGQPVRSPNLVLLAGIVGVPWQDIATPESLDGADLEYLTANELTEQGRWSMILGDADALPTDPLMHESITPRTGVHPLLGVALAPPTATGSANPINGHEQNVPKNDDLQYACTFELPTPRQCGDNASTCDCMAADQASNRSLCEFPDGPGTDGIQVAAKAYPGLRELSVIKGVEENGIVASICPKRTQPAAGMTAEGDPSYGYNPAIAALSEIFTVRLARQCLPRQLDVTADPASSDYGQVSCAVVEVVKPKDGACACDAKVGRLPLTAADEQLGPAVLERLRGEGRCGAGTGLDCANNCLCKVRQLEGAELTSCLEGNEAASTYGYCYIDPSKGVGNPALVEDCPAIAKRSLRLVGDGLPANGSTTFMACVGGAIDDTVQSP